MQMLAQRIWYDVDQARALPILQAGEEDTQELAREIFEPDDGTVLFDSDAL